MPYLLETFTASSGSTASKRAFNPRVAALKSSLLGKRSLVEGQSSVMRAASLSERLRALDEQRLACRKQHEAGPEPCSVRPAESELQARGRSLFRQIGQTTMVKIGCPAAGRVVGSRATQLWPQTNGRANDRLRPGRPGPRVLFQGCRTEAGPFLVRNSTCGASSPFEHPREGGEVFEV
jgi:hypothetical protein